MFRSLNSHWGVKRHPTNVPEDERYVLLSDPNDKDSTPIPRPKKVDQSNESNDSNESNENDPNSEESIVDDAANNGDDGKREEIEDDELFRNGQIQSEPRNEPQNVCIVCT